MDRFEALQAMMEHGKIVANENGYKQWDNERYWYDPESTFIFQESTMHRMTMTIGVFLVDFEQSRFHIYYG